MLLQGNKDNWNIVYRKWHKNYAYTQVREHIEEWEIKSFVRILDIEIKIVSKCSKVESFEEMVKQADEVGQQLEHNADVLTDVINKYQDYLVDKYLEIVGEYKDYVVDRLLNGGLDRLRHELLSGHIDATEISDHVGGFMAHLCAEIQAEKASGGQ